MNREDIMQLMEEAGFNTNFFSPDGVDKFGRFAQLVAAAEREKVAQMFDGQVMDKEGGDA